MEFIDNCRKFGVLEALQDTLTRVANYYSINNTINGLPFIEKVVDLADDEDGNTREFRITIRESNANHVYLNTVATVYDDYGPLYDVSEVEGPLSVNEVRVLKLYLDHFNESPRQKYQRM